MGRRLLMVMVALSVAVAACGDGVSQADYDETVAAIEAQRAFLEEAVDQLVARADGCEAATGLTLEIFESVLGIIDANPAAMRRVLEGDSGVAESLFLDIGILLGATCGNEGIGEAVSSLLVYLDIWIRRPGSQESLAFMGGMMRTLCAVESQGIELSTVGHAKCIGR